MDIQNYSFEGKVKVPSYNGTASLYVHKKTAFKVLLVDNSDVENFFSYIVYTPSRNSSGVFHIIEHTVLSGSERYPVKDAFTTAMAKACPTFMNAMTGADRTYYLASSAVEKDFNNLFKVYTDSVFSPLLRKETFLQEGIRVCYKDTLHFDGVVFSEMQGATSQHESVLSSLSSHGLFPGCEYENESGGLPKEIARLSYEEYLETFKKYYVPSNMMLLLYGKVDKKPFLEFLDREYLSKRDYIEPPKKVIVGPKWSAPRVKIATSACSDEGEEKKGSVLFSYRLGESSNNLEGATLNVLTDMLLGSPGCPLYKAITDSKYAEDISTESGMIWDYSEYAFAFGMSGVKREDEEKAASALLSSLEEIAEKGFTEREKEAALRRYEFNLKEISGGNPQGMKVLFRIDKAFAYGKDILSSLFPEEDAKELRKASSENPRYFEDYIQKNFIENPHRLLSIVRMDKNKDKEIDDEMERILKEEAEKHPESEEDEFIAFSLSEDDPSDLEKFGTLSLSDLDHVEFIKNPVALDEKIAAVGLFSNGIVYFDAAFDVSDLSLKELESLNVYSRLLTMCSTKEKDMRGVQTDLRYTSGGYAFYIESGESLKGEAKVYFLFRMRALRETAHDALLEFIKLLKDGLIQEEEVSNALTDISTDYKSGVIQSGHSYAISSSSAPLSSSLYIGEKLSGLSFWYTIEEKRGDVKGETEAIKKVREKLLDSSRIKVQVYSDECNKDFMRNEAEFFLSSFESKNSERKGFEIDHDFPKKSAFLLSSPVSYSALSADISSLDWEKSLSARIFLWIMGTDSLWDLIRSKGGAYGTGALLDKIESRMFFYTYRDPRLFESIKDFEKAVEIEELSEKKIEDAKINVRSLDIKPQSPSQKALTYLRRSLYNVDDDYRRKLRDDIMKVELEDLESIRGELIALIKEKGSISIISDRKEEGRLRDNGYDIYYLPL